MSGLCSSWVEKCIPAIINSTTGDEIESQCMFDSISTLITLVPTDSLTLLSPLATDAYIYWLRTYILILRPYAVAKKRISEPAWWLTKLKPVLNVTLSTGFEYLPDWKASNRYCKSNFSESLKSHIFILCSFYWHTLVVPYQIDICLSINT